MQIVDLSAQAWADAELNTEVDAGPSNQTANAMESG
jgi:hypothetical protein